MDQSLMTTSEFVKFWRGSRSQRSFNFELGFAPHRIHNLESGRAQLRWNEAVVMAICAGIPLQHHLSKLLDRPITSASSMDFLPQLMHGKSQAWIAKRLQVSRYKVCRWLGGNIEPRLEDVMQIAHACGVSPHRLQRAMTGDAGAGDGFSKGLSEIVF
jgi:hypothetical protein